MNIQNLVRERVIGNIKTGTKGANGLPQKLPYFHVEEDKATTSDMVEIFKQLYPNKPTKLKIQFTSEDPFNFKFKRYINGKAVCIGNGVKAITVGKDSRNNNTQIEIECNKECEQRLSGKCKLKGSLKFVLEGINAGGVWNLSTSGGFSLSNIATEIVKYKNAGMSIVGVPFELTLTEQQSLAYGTYYSIDLHRTDIKPQLVADTLQQLPEADKKDSKKLIEGTKSKDKKEKTDIKVEKQEETEQDIPKSEEPKQDDFSNYLTFKKALPTLISGKKFDKIIFEDIHGQDVEYILHPKANQELMSLGIGTVIELKESKIEMDRNILCKYDIKQAVNTENINTELNSKEELKKAV